MQDLNLARVPRVALLLAALTAAFFVAQSATAHTAQSRGSHARVVERRAAKSGVVAHAASAATGIYATSDPAGTILTTKAGRVMFIFPKDKRNKNVCQESPKCAGDWPAVTTTGAVKLGPGVKRSLLKLIPFKGKLKQVTYAGHPLHLYKHDDGPSVSFTFIGIKQFGARWDALTPSGKIVKSPGG